MPFLKYLTPKHLSGLILALLISFLILYYTPQIQEFRTLGYAGVFLISLLGNATVVLPAPALAFVFLLGGSLPNPFFVGVLAGIGATLGEITGFLAGYSSSGIVSHTKTYKKIEGYVTRYGLFAVFLLALIPNPLFDIAGMAAGALNIKWWKFLLAAGIGKIIKSLVFAYSGAYFL